jgi:hypothetical protein
MGVLWCGYVGGRQIPYIHVQLHNSAAAVCVAACGVSHTHGSDHRHICPMPHPARLFLPD